MFYGLRPHPPQRPQSHPHCRDLPFFLSCIIFLMTSPTNTARTAAVITVPINASFINLSCTGHFFHIRIPCTAFLIGPEKKINKSGYQKYSGGCTYAKYSCRKQSPYLVNAQRSSISKYCLIADCKPEPLYMIHLPLNRSHCRKAGGA